MAICISMQIVPGASSAHAGDPLAQSVCGRRMCSDLSDKSDLSDIGAVRAAKPRSGESYLHSGTRSMTSTHSASGSSVM